MGITKHFTTMQSYLPKYPLVSECVWVRERMVSQKQHLLLYIWQVQKYVLQLKVTFFKRNRAKKLFPKAAHLCMHVRVHFTKNATDVQFSVCGRPRWMWTSAIIVCHYSFQPRQPRKSKVFWLSPLAQKGKKMTRKTKKSQKSHSFHSREWKSGCNGVEEVWNDRETERWMHDRRIWYMRGLDRGRTRWSHGVLLNLKLVIVGGKEQGREKSIG